MTRNANIILALVNGYRPLDSHWLLRAEVWLRPPAACARAGSAAVALRPPRAAVRGLGRGGADRPVRLPVRPARARTFAGNASTVNLKGNNYAQAV